MNSIRCKAILGAALVALALVGCGSSGPSTPASSGRAWTIGQFLCA